MPEIINIPDSVNTAVDKALALLSERANAAGIRWNDGASYWELCGICMRDGEQAMMDYAATVKLRGE